jgi:hypothetical protein
MLALNEAASRKQAAFDTLAQAGRVNVHEDFVYRPWAISTYGNIHPLFLSDLHHLAATRARCAFSGNTAQLSRREKKERRLLLIYMSYKLQVALSSFFGRRVAQCSP